MEKLINRIEIEKENLQEVINSGMHNMSTEYYQLSLSMISNRANEANKKQQSQIEYMQLLAKWNLSQNAYRCLLLLFDGVPRTASQIADELQIQRQNINRTLINLQDIEGLIQIVKEEGRNKFYKAVTTYDEYIKLNK